VITADGKETEIRFGFGKDNYVRILVTPRIQQT
jgi:hypothetical protein